MNKNNNIPQSKPGSDGKFDHRGGAQTPSYRKPTPPPSPTPKKP